MELYALGQLKTTKFGAARTLPPYDWNCCQN
jgi:hypothetical protein